MKKIGLLFAFVLLLSCGLSAEKEKQLLLQADAANELGQFDEAIKHLETVVKKSPDNREAKQELIGTYVLKGEFEQAARLIQKILKENPRDPEARYWANFIQPLVEVKNEE